MGDNHNLLDRQLQLLVGYYNLGELTMKSLAAFLFLAVCGLASAEGFAPGYTTAAGYVLNADGLWYYGSQAYTRTLVTIPGYYATSNCCRYWVASSSYYQYTIVPKVQLPSYTEPGWRTQLLAIAANRDKFEGDIRLKAVEHQNYLEAVNALGLTGNFRWNGYGQSVAYGSYYAPPVNFGANANTQYGYSATYAASFGQSPDLNVLYQQANQLALNSQRLGGEATAGHQGLVAQAGGNQARVAEILAKGQAGSQLALAVANAVAAAPSTETRGFRFDLKPGGVVVRTEDPKLVTPEIRTKLKEQFEALAVAKCGDCHGDTGYKGNFKIGDYYTLSQEQKNRVWERISTQDNSKVMPRDSKGGPGVRLTPEEQKSFFLN